ncbi:MAG: c-type cytochrome [Longimicrobiaceae bacterium]
MRTRGPDRRRGFGANGGRTEGWSMVMRMGAVAAAAAVLLTACGRDGGDAGRSTGQGERTASAAQEEETASPGRDLYRRACVMCHGERGAGTALGPALNDRRRELADVVRVVEAGAPAADTASYTPMPPRGDGTFTDQDVRAVAEYVRSLAR